MFTPPRGTAFVPNFGRIEWDTSSGMPVPSGNNSLASSTPHFLSVSVASWQMSIAFAKSFALFEFDIKP